MKYYSYSMALAASGDLHPADNMAVGLTYAASEAEAVANIRCRCSARGIEIGYFEAGHEATAQPTGGFAMELRASTSALDRCVITSFSGSPIARAA